MPYASFCCTVQAPLAKVWESLQKRVQQSPRAGASGASFTIKRLGANELCVESEGLQLHECVSDVADEQQLVLCLMQGQHFQGQRRITMNIDASGEAVRLESSLDWGPLSPEAARQDRILLPLTDLLVRDLILQVKSDAESR